MTSLLDLGAGPLSQVLKRLEVPDLLRAAQACRALRHAAQDESVWHAKALELYPPETVRLEQYGSYQDLVRDDNAEHATLLLYLDLSQQQQQQQQQPLPPPTPLLPPLQQQQQGAGDGGGGPSSSNNHSSGDGEGRGARSSAGAGGCARAPRTCSCRYKLNSTESFYECLALALEWDRASHTFRLYLEARGEADLRQPGESSLGFTVHRQPPPDRRALERQVAQLQQRRVQLEQELAAAVERDAGTAIRAAEHALARNATQQRAAELELGREFELRFADLLTVVRPAGQALVEDKQGHKLGYLTFDSLHKIDALLQELPDSYVSKQHAQQRGVDLCFSYANPIPVMPHGVMVDYEPCILATVPPGASLLTVFRSQGCYAVPGRLLQELAGEGPRARGARWMHVPSEVRARQPPWMV